MSAPFPPAPPQGPPLPAPSAKPKPLAIIALVTAAIGFVFACIPGALIIGWVLLPVAFILSLVALFQPGRKWPAITGLVVSIVGTIVGFVVFLAVVVDSVDEAIDEAVGDQDVAVTIDATRQDKDYEGKPALVVDLTFTNDGDDAASYLWGATTKAFQNGVELESATLKDEDTSNHSKEIKPGTSIKVQEAYVLNDASEVTIEVTDAFGLGDEPLAERKVQVEAVEGQAFGEAHSQYAVTIDGSRQLTDYEGKPALQVDFTFTNNSDEAQSFVFAVSAKAFQNGTELSDAFLRESDSDNAIKEIKPGKSIKVQDSFVLDGSGDVTIEVTENFDLDDKMLTTATIAVD